MNSRNHAGKLGVADCRNILGLHVTREPSIKSVPAGLLVQYPLVIAHFITAPIRVRSFFAVVGYSVRIGFRTSSR